MFIWIRTYNNYENNKNKRKETCFGIYISKKLDEKIPNNILRYYKHTALDKTLINTAIFSHVPH